jgi:transcriptional regulator with XRE-family HTH domain
MTTIGSRELQRRHADLTRWIAQQVRDQRLEAATTQARLATCAGIEQSMVSKVESGKSRPSLEVLVAIAACLGADLSVRLFPAAGPRLHDRFQAPMIEALIGLLDPGWRARPEVVVRSAHGVIDLVLARALDRLTVACECHSELRRLELVLRRAAEKTDGLRGELGASATVSSMLLLRSTRATRELARAYEATLMAAYPARTADVVAALRGKAAWPGPAIVWVRLEHGVATILDAPPRGVRLGR